MLPTYLPIKALETLIRDHSTLTADQSDEYTPLEMLTGYLEGGEYGGMPFENPESNETDPMARLKHGERLVIQLHLESIQCETAFIDGKPYVATKEEIARDEDNTEESEAFPDETGFFGVGVWLEGDQLRLEPVRISGDFNGNVCVVKAVFPPSLSKRTGAYLKKLA